MFKSMGRVWRHLIVGVAASVAVYSGNVSAQTTPVGWSPSAPATVTSLDSFGIDLISGQPDLTELQLSIGAKGSELTHSFLEYTMLDENAGAVVSQSSVVDPTPRVSVSLGKNSETFIISGSAYINAQGSPSTLVGNSAAGTLTYTKADGTIAVFNTAWAAGPTPRATAVLQSLTLPSGEQLTYYYQNVGSQAPNWWVKTVTSNLSLMLKYEYGSFGTKVTAVNTAVDYCDPIAISCAGLTKSWPVGYISNGVTTTQGLGTSSTTQTVIYTETNALGKARTRTYFVSTQCMGGSQIIDGSVVANGACDSKDSLTLADEVGHAKTYVYSDIWSGPSATPLFPNGMVIGVAVGGLNRSYSYIASGGLQHPWTSSVTAISSGTNGSAFSLTFIPSNSNYFSVMPTAKTVLGHVSTYTRDSYGRVTKVTNPEGDYLQYSYDARGNFYQAMHVSKDGSQSITWHATFPVTCSNPKTCNKPTASFDAKNYETDYTYDDNSGEVATVTKPADANGMRPQTRYSYTPMYAQVMSSAGTLVSQPSPIYLLTKVSECASSVSCANGADERVTEYAYNSSNLFPTSVTQRSGNNALSRTVTTTYDAMGNPIVVDGPRTDVDDRSYMTYDGMRRVVFEVGIDPDGSGALPRVIVHHVYDDAGYEVRTETGTGNATDGSDFTRTSYVVTSYNSAGAKSMVASYIDGGATPQSLTQYSYDASGRVTCSTIRMNSSVYSTIAGMDACVLGSTGGMGPDRITVNSYDAGDELTEIDQAYGVTSANGYPQTQRAYARYSYNVNGTKATETDANGNMTQYAYDGFDRLQRIYYPCPATQNCANGNDYEEFGYDANGNRTSWRRRNGATITYGYDALNRATTEGGSAVPDMAARYDLLGNMLAKYYTSSGVGVTNTYDGLGRLSATTDMNGRTVSYDYN